MKYVPQSKLFAMNFAVVLSSFEAKLSLVVLELASLLMKPIPAHFAFSSWSYVTDMKKVCRTPYLWHFYTLQILSESFSAALSLLFMLNCYNDSNLYPYFLQIYWNRNRTDENNYEIRLFKNLVWINYSNMCKHHSIWLFYDTLDNFVS